MYIRYIHKLYDLHLKAQNFTGKSIFWLRLGKWAGRQFIKHGHSFAFYNYSWELKHFYFKIEICFKLDSCFQVLSFSLYIFFLSIYLGIFLEVASGLQTIYVTLHSLLRVSILPLQVIYRNFTAT